MWQLTYLGSPLMPIIAGVVYSQTYALDCMSLAIKAIID
jgi:hypothetical protein